jgi:hypothetical protein
MARGINGATSEFARLTNCPQRRVSMAFASYCDFEVDAETNGVLDVALEMTRNPDLLCEGALKKLRGGLFGD